MTTAYVQSWFARGDDDLALVKLILEGNTGSPNLAYFHAQQAAEKYLKGFLAHHDLHVRRIHDLEVLLEDCKSIDPSLEQIQDNVGFLNQFYVESRYPDDYREFSRGDAEKALVASIRIKNFVLSKIKPQETNRGFGTLTILAIIAGLLIIVGGGFLVYRQYLPAEKPVEQKLSATTEISPKDKVDTSNWKTYRNEKYGFEVVKFLK